MRSAFFCCWVCCSGPQKIVGPAFSLPWFSLFIPCMWNLSHGVAERKDVLCGLFFILTLWAYVLYVERPGLLRYAPIVLLFICGIMTKPMIVTLPLIALLMDAWPLRRLSRKSVVEKIPLFVLSAATAIMAYVVQQRGGSVSSLENSPLSLRLQNAAVSYVVYMGQFLWPTDSPSSIRFPI